MSKTTLNCFVYSEYISSHQFKIWFEPVQNENEKSPSVIYIKLAAPFICDSCEEAVDSRIFKEAQCVVLVNHSCQSFAV